MEIIAVTQHWQHWHKLVQQWQQHWWLMSCPITGSSSSGLQPPACAALIAIIVIAQHWQQWHKLVQQWQQHWWLMSCPITGSSSSGLQPPAYAALMAIIVIAQHWQPWHKLVQQWQQHWWLMSFPITGSTSPATSLCSPDGNHSGNSALAAVAQACATYSGSNTGGS
jgi:hypothetical protein